MKPLEIVTHLRISARGRKCSGNLCSFLLSLVIHSLVWSFSRWETLGESGSAALFSPLIERDNTARLVDLLGTHWGWKLACDLYFFCRGNFSVLSTEVKLAARVKKKCSNDRVGEETKKVEWTCITMVFILMVLTWWLTCSYMCTILGKR